MAKASAPASPSVLHIAKYFLLLRMKGQKSGSKGAETLGWVSKYSLALSDIGGSVHRHVAPPSSPFWASACSSFALASAGRAWIAVCKSSAEASLTAVAAE